MKNVTARRIGVAAGLLILVAAFFLGNLLKEMKEPPPRRSAFEQVVSVDVMRVKNGDIPTSLKVQGELVAYDKIDLFAEVSGTLVESSRPFKVGSFFPKGSLLIRIEADEARLSLLSQKSDLLNSITQMMPDFKVDYPESFAHWQEYLRNYELEGPLRSFPEPANDQERFYIASRNLYSQYYSIKSAEERLEKYDIVAPFSGVITEASIHPGALVRNGQKLGELMSTGAYELEVTVPLADLRYIAIGNPVSLASNDINGSWTGKVRRINDQVDPTTQTVKVFIDVRGRELKEGMYLQGEVEAMEIEQAVRIPRDLLTDQRGIFVVQDSVLRYQDLEVVKITASSAIVRGLKDGAVLLQEPLPSAFDGMKVRVRNESARAEEEPITEMPLGG